MLVSQSNKYLESKKLISFARSLLIVVENDRDVVAKVEDIVAKNRDEACFSF